MGSAVSDDWKEGARAAVAAAANALGEDSGHWTITIKNRTFGGYTDGASVSSVVAVGIMAGRRGNSLRNEVALTGVISPGGRIGPVGGLPAKLQGAAAARIDTILVPKGQARTPERDFLQLGQQRNVTVIEVSSLAEAYELMTGKRP